MNDESGGGSRPAGERRRPRVVLAMRLVAFAGAVAVGGWGISQAKGIQALLGIIAALALMTLAFWRLPEPSASVAADGEALQTWAALLRRHAQASLVALTLLLSGACALLLLASPQSFQVGALLWLASLVAFLLAVGWKSLPRVAAAWRGGWLARWRAALSTRAVQGELLLVAAIFFLALGLRAVALDQYPPVMHGDEGEMGLVSLQVLKGSPLISPFTTAWLAHPTMFNYWQAGAMALFGTDLGGLRILSALAGTLSVLVMYLLMRFYAGWVAAAVAALLMAVSHLYIQFSRIALNNVESAGFAVLVVLLLAVARSRRSAAWSGLAGLACGYSLYFYFGSRVIPFIVVALMAYMIVEGSLSRAAAGAFVLGFVAAIVPLAANYALHPGDFTGRMQGVFLLTDQNVLHVAGGSSMTWLDLLGRQIQRNLLFFVKEGDASAFYLRDLPAFDPVTALLFWMGMAVALTRVLRFQEFSLLVWFGTAFVIGGVLTNDAPNAPRLLLAVPAVFALAGLFAARLKTGVSAYLHLRLDAVAVAAILLLGAITLKTNYDLYFTEYATRTQGTGLLTMGRELQTWGNDYKVYFLGAPNMYAGHGTLRFVGRNAETVDAFGPQDYIPLRSGAKGSLFIILPHRLAEAPAIRDQYPGGEYKEFWDKMNRLQFVSYRYRP